MEFNFEDLNMAKMKLLLERYNGQQKSKKKYYEKNKTVINEYAKKYMVDKYNTDEEFREKQKAYARERNNKNRNNPEFKERQNKATKEYRERQKLKKRIIEMQNEPALQEFGELDIIIQ
jgi:hypothetical protein